MARAFGATLGAGSTDAISIPCSTPNDGPTTYHIKAFRNGAGGGGFGRYFHRGVPEAPVFFYHDDSGNRFTITTGGETLGGQWDTTGHATSTWVDIVVTQTGVNAPSIYFDGVSQTVSTVFSPSGSALTTTPAFVVGNRPSDSARGFDGALAEFAVWNRILDVNEIASLGAGLTPSCIPNGLVLYAPLIRDAVDMRGQGAAPTVTGTAVYPHPRVYETPSGQDFSVPAAAVSGVSGSLSTTEPPDAAALAANFVNQASLATTDRPDAAAISATVANLAQLATTDRPDAAAAAVTVSTGASLAATEAPDAAAVAATFANLAQLAATEAPDVAAISAAPVLVSLGATEPPDAAALNALLAQLGSFAVTEAPDTSSLAATVANQAALATTEAPDAAALAASVTAGMSGSLSTTEAPDTAVLAANFNLQAALATTEAPDVAAIAAKLNVFGSLATTEAPDTAAVAANLNVFGPLATTDRPDSASISAALTSPPIGVLAATEAPDAAAIGITAAGVFAVQVAASEPPDVVSAAAWTYPWHSVASPSGVWTPVSGSGSVWTPVPRPH
jgi:hypothetical protein